MSPARAVLLVTHAADHFTIDRVRDGVARRGARPIRLDTDRFPGELQLTARLGDRERLRLRDGDEEVDLGDVAAVWLRRVMDPARPEGLDDLEAAQCAREARATLEGWLGLFADAAWLDPLPRVRAAEDKLAQLRAARRVGLRVPRTVVGNDPDEVRALWRDTGGAMVTKMLTALTRTMGAPPAAVYTTALTAADLEDLDGLALSPMIFQERIAKVRELRVIYVAGRCFTGAIAADRDDWRTQAAGAASPWTIGELPAEDAARLDQLMRGLGLGFGAADFVVDAEGCHHFLEVNPGGEWGMLERDLGLPIADAIAEVLCR